MECAQCDEKVRKSEARETCSGEHVCQDCADDMTACDGCELLFEPDEPEQALCEGCRDPDEDEDEAVEPRPVDETLATEARGVVEQVAGSMFYAEQHEARKARRMHDKAEHMPRLRAEVTGELAGMNDAELTAWVSDCWLGPTSLVLAADGRETPPAEELARRLGIFTAALRASLNLGKEST